MSTISRLKLLATSLLLAACTNDVVETSYVSRAEAESSGAIARGWVPDWIPVNAEDIREVHDIDTNESALVFALPPGTAWHLPSSCRTAEGGEFSKTRFRRSWIPPVDDQARYYSCAGKRVDGPPLIEAIAIMQGGERVLHWRVFAR